VTDKRETTDLAKASLAFFVPVGAGKN
jgi:hypothetical protein